MKKRVFDKETLYIYRHYIWNKFNNAVYFPTSKHKDLFLCFSKVTEQRMKLGWIGAVVSSVDRWETHRRQFDLMPLKKITYEKV